MKLKLKKIYEEIESGVDPKAQASANAILLMDKLRTNPAFMKMISQIQMPSDKYTAIKKFADLLGIPGERFSDFCTQQENQMTESTIVETTHIEEWDKNSIEEFLDVSGLGEDNLKWSTTAGGFAGGDYGKIKFQTIADAYRKNAKTQLLISFENSQEMNAFWNRASHQLINPYDFHRHQGLRDNQLMITFYQ